MNNATSNNLALHLFQHFSGKLCVVNTVATSVETGEPQVIYQYLNGGAVESMSLTQFTEQAPQDSEVNLTGQTLVFEPVQSVGNILIHVPTDTLLKELRSRNDCPLFASPDNIFREEYLAGRIENIFVDEDNSFDDFDLLSPVMDTEEDMKRWLQVHDPVKSMTVMRRVMVIQNFD